ncbi:hypothetical protein ABIC28_005175 [Rhodococcus sp. PvR044]|uniref:hypothetical protein n=1 Tax=Rhodococcus sp. PvR044 TaxID=3156402 RepID=UPI0033923F78
MSEIELGDDVIGRCGGGLGTHAGDPASIQVHDPASSADSASSLSMMLPSYAARLRHRHAQLAAVRDGTSLVVIEPTHRQGRA